MSFQRSSAGTDHGSPEGPATSTARGGLGARRERRAEGAATVSRWTSGSGSLRRARSSDSTTPAGTPAAADKWSALERN